MQRSCRLRFSYESAGPWVRASARRAAGQPCNTPPIEEIMAQPWTVAIVFVAAMTAAQAAAPQASAQPQPSPVLDNVDLMDLMVKPAYDALRQAVTHPPADRKAWAILYQQAARLAELENLLFFRVRAGNERQGEWIERAARARDASAAVAA